MFEKVFSFVLVFGSSCVSVLVFRCLSRCSSSGSSLFLFV